MTYLATFYTHAAALISHRNLVKNGIDAVMMPVPRAVSSSCGTCVKYRADDPSLSFLDNDKEAVYEITDAGYNELIRYE